MSTSKSGSRPRATHGGGDARVTVGDAQAAGDASSQVTVCAVCNQTDKLLRCSRCKAVFYCTKEHQKHDWKRHREFCATHPAREDPTEEPTESAPPAAPRARKPRQKTPSRQHQRPAASKSSRGTTPNALVPNLSKCPVSDAPNVISESACRYAKHLAGTFVSFFLLYLLFFLAFFQPESTLSAFARYCAVINNKSPLLINS